jgi:hypothetical protein
LVFGTGKTSVAFWYHANRLPLRRPNLDCGKGTIKANDLSGGYVWTAKDDDAKGTLVKALDSGRNP